MVDVRLPTRTPRVAQRSRRPTREVRLSRWDKVVVRLLRVLRDNAKAARGDGALCDGDAGRVEATDGGFSVDTGGGLNGSC